MWTAIAGFLFVLLFANALGDESERPRLFGVPTRRGLVDNDDPNHLRAAENSHRRILFDQLETDKATSIFASVEKNPLTRTTVDTTLSYTKAPVNLDEILRKRRSPIIADFDPEQKNLEAANDRHEVHVDEVTTKEPRKAKILFVSELDDDPFEIPETATEQSLLKDIVQPTLPQEGAQPETATKETEELKGEEMTTERPAVQKHEGVVSVIDDDAQFVPEKRTVVRHLHANNLRTTLNKLRLRRSVVDSATEVLDRSEIQNATISTPPEHSGARTTMKTPIQRTVKTPNTSNFVALDNQSSREVVEREEIRVIPKLVRKGTVAPTTTSEPLLPHVPVKVLSEKTVNVIDIDAIENITEIATSTFPPVVAKQAIGPDGPPIVWNEFIVGEGRRILVKSIPAVYLNGQVNLPTAPFQHSGVMQASKKNIAIVESEAVVAKDPLPVTVRRESHHVTDRPSTTLKVSVIDESQESAQQPEVRDQVKNEDLQVLRIFEREGTTRTAMVTKQMVTSPSPQTSVSVIPRIVKPTLSHEAAMKVAARNAPFPPDVPMAKSDIPDPKQFSKNTPMLISIKQRAAAMRSNGQKLKFRARDFTPASKRRSRPVNSRFSVHSL
ncbi:hypothetical protein L596_001604 [Steinernema carpocapsae]|uniref:DUF4758 domain-containing protein n=1 Tax=Steinernema carpocapsae TaxID=34508 RepID=A0A4U8UQM8_STECR|nr:hypothetical protein L596_001604 [Steinernema carpocapsae]